MKILYNLFYREKNSSERWKQLPSSLQSMDANQAYRYLELNCNKYTFEWEVREQQ